jgi:hypothetical protein
MVKSWFVYVPYIGLLFHLVGGYCVAVILYNGWHPYLLPLPWLMGLLVQLGWVAMATIAWEVLEYMCSSSAIHPLNQNVYAVLEDEVIGILGGLVFVVRAQ